MISDSNINIYSSEADNKAHINVSVKYSSEKDKDNAISRAMVTERLLDILNKYSKDA